MTTHTITAADWLAYIRRQGTHTLEFVTDWIAGNADETDYQNADSLCDAIDSVRDLIAEPPLANPYRYSDGRPVFTQFELEYGCTFQHVWHPDPAHKRNQPGPLCIVDTPSGKRRRVVITAPGILDALDVLSVVNLDEAATDD